MGVSVKDSTRRASLFAKTAGDALVIVDSRKIILNDNSVVRASLLALHTTDAGDLALLTRDTAALLVGALYVYRAKGIHHRDY